MIFLDLFLLIAGLVILVKGADYFVDGAADLAKAMKIPALIIGLTLVSIGTSAPELSVSITSALAGANDIALGNVIGSNTFNTFIVIGASALFVNLTVSTEMKRYDIPILVSIYTLLAAFVFLFTPGRIDRLEGIILILLFIAYLAFLLLRAKRNPTEPEEENFEPREWYRNLFYIVLGLLMIILGGNLVVDHASALAAACGMSELLVGLTIVAIGTSLPELVTSIVAAKKGEHHMAVGNAIGSSLFNIMLILGTSSVIHPIRTDASAMVDMAAMLLSAVLVYLFTLKSGKIGRLQGILLIALYIAYTAYVILRGLGFLEFS